MKILFRILVALVAGASCASALAAVTASLDRDHIASGDIVRLLVQSDSASGQPDIAPLMQDFNVLANSRGSSVQLINGHASSQTQVVLILAPKHAGTIRIPPLQWGSEQSQPLELTVDGNAAGPNTGSGANTGTSTGSAAVSDPVFFTTTLDNKQPYVQAPVVLTVQIHASVPLDQADLDLQGNGDVLVKQIGKDTQSGETRNGRNYQVVERRYLLIPQRSGRISLKGPLLDAQIQDPGSSPFPDLDALMRRAFGQGALGSPMGMVRPLHLSANPIELNVLPRPAAATGANWLPAQKLTLEESWRPDSGELHVGEPLTRHLHLAAVGLTGAQLPELSTLIVVPDGIKIYPDQAKVDDDTSGATISGSRDQDIALIASRPGRYVLPAVKLAWWDTAGKVQREAVLPARTLEILPASGAQNASVASPPATAGMPPSATSVPAQSAPLPQAPASAPALPWKWISAALALLWLGTVVAWWRAHLRAKKAPLAVTSTDAQAPAKPPGKPRPVKLPAGSALSALQRACRDNDAAAARRHLLDWAADFWPDAPPRGLNAVAERLADARFVEPLKELDRACYTGSAWKGDALAHAFAAAPKQASMEKTRTEIPDLYT
jgi:hypothetical protein